MSGCNPDVEQTAQPGVRRLWPLTVAAFASQISVDRHVPNMASGEGTSVEQALVGGTPQRVGWYRFHYADERWEWSPEVELIHGYRPGTSNPTTELGLSSHKHPEDFETRCDGTKVSTSTSLPQTKRVKTASPRRSRTSRKNGSLSNRSRESCPLVYRIVPGAAFDLLKWRSQEANIKLRAWLNNCCRLPSSGVLRGRAIARNRRTTGHRD